jgi:AcrR family transcriptional regulator
VNRIALDDRRTALLSAAIRVIARDGLAAATTRAIVAEAGMPLGSFHYAFDSREALLSAVIDTVTSSERIAAETTVFQSGAPVDLSSTLLAGIVRYIELLEVDPEREQALQELSLYAIRHNTAAALEQVRAYHRSAEHSLALAAEVCNVRWNVPVADASRFLVVALDGITTTWLADRDGDAARRAAAFVAPALAALAQPEGSESLGVPSTADLPSMPPVPSTADVPSMPPVPSAPHVRSTPPVPSIPHKERIRAD